MDFQTFGLRLKIVCRHLFGLAGFVFYLPLNVLEDLAVIIRQYYIELIANIKFVALKYTEI